MAESATATATATKRTVVFVLIDGLADVSLHELGDRTTLEAAHTPAMDAVARTSKRVLGAHSHLHAFNTHMRLLVCACARVVGGGLTGLLDPVAPGFACGSDTAHMSILGYDPVMYDRLERLAAHSLLLFDLLWLLAHLRATDTSNNSLVVRLQRL